MKTGLMQRQTKITPMVEGGVLSAIAIMFAFLSAYVPILGGFVNLIWPVPIILLGVRHGHKWSLLATVVAGILIAVLMGPLHALSVVVGFGLIGIALGHSIRVNFSPSKTMIWGSVASMISQAAIIGLGIIITGTNPFNIQTELMTKSLEEAMGIYRSLGVFKEEDLAKMKEMMVGMLDLLKIILPSGLILASIVTAWLNYSVAKAVLKKMGHYIAPFPPFKDWNMPKAVLYAFVVAGLAIYWGGSRELTWLYNAGMNLQMVCIAFLIVQGLALFYFLADKYNLSRFIRSIILVLVFTNGIVMQIILFAGAVDLAINYRQQLRNRAS